MYTKAVLLSLMVTIMGTSACPQQDCSMVPCPRPLCANPTLRPGECCPTCENSNCKFEGCVNFNVGGQTQWAPDPCSICHCDMETNRAICGAIGCVASTQEACRGYPVVTKPNKCCAECDFGVPDDTCQLVPLSQDIQIVATQGRVACGDSIIPNRCDKSKLRSGDKKFRCEPVEGSNVATVAQPCLINQVTYTDVVSCRIVEDDTLFVGCDLVVN